MKKANREVVIEQAQASAYAQYSSDRCVLELRRCAIQEQIAAHRKGIAECEAQLARLDAERAQAEVRLNAARDLARGTF